MAESCSRDGSILQIVSIESGYEKGHIVSQESFFIDYLRKKTKKKEQQKFLFVATLKRFMAYVQNILKASAFIGNCIVKHYY